MELALSGSLKGGHIYELTYLYIMGKLRHKTQRCLKGKIRILKRDKWSYITIPSWILSWPKPLVRTNVIRKPDLYFLQPQLDHKMALLGLPEVCHEATACREAFFPVRMGTCTSRVSGTPVTLGHTPAERWQCLGWELNWYKIHSEQEAQGKQVLLSPPCWDKAQETRLLFSGEQGSPGALSTEPAFQCARGLVLVCFPSFIFHKNKVQPHNCPQNIYFC